MAAGSKQHLFLVATSLRSSPIIVPLTGGAVAGFGLFELVLVLILLGIISVFVAPTLLSGSVTLPAVATQLAEAVRLTQSLSMSKGQRYRINFTANSYQITDMAGAAIVQPMTNSTAAAVVSPVVMSGYNPPLINGYVAFDSRGVPYVSATATLAANATITLTSGTNTTTLTIVSQTGRVN